MSRRPSRTDPDRPARAAIVEAAARLFGEKGYHGTSVRDISNEVGILAGSLYSHIATKQELLAEILRGYSTRARAVLEPLEDAPLSTRDKLREVFAIYFRMTAEAPSQARVAVHDFRSLAPDELEASRQRRRDTQAIVVRILDHASFNPRKSAPQRGKAVLTGLAAGLGAWAGFALLRQFLDVKVRFPKNLERTLGVKVLGIVPEQKRWKRIGRRIRARFAA